MQLASTSTPRSANNSATCSYDSGYRRYQRTHKMTTSLGCWRPLKGEFGVIGIDIYHTNMSASEVRNGTIISMSRSEMFHLANGESSIMMRKGLMGLMRL